MTHFIKRGNRFLVAPQQDLDIHPILPVGTYAAKFNPDTAQYYLEQIEDFTVSGKLYGDTERHAQRIMTTFEKRTSSTGVLLSGEKGSGKSLLAKYLSVVARQDDIPTIVVNEALYGETFNQFIQSIGQAAVVILDEFEKVYEREEQDKMLTLLDGLYPSKKLFVLTCNDKYRVNEHLKNRPGRVFYHLDYAGLDNEFIIEYCEDKLDNKENIQSVARAAMMFSSFNFDMLKAMVEEMNRYDETAIEVIDMLNAKPENSDNKRFDVKLIVNGVQIPRERLYRREWIGNPLTSRVNIEYVPMAETDMEADIVAPFGVSDLIRVDPSTGEYHYKNASEEELVLIKVKEQVYDWRVF